MTHKTYIGDSVYAEYDGYSIRLTTDNGYGTTNTILLERPIYESLVSWMEHLKERLAAEAKKESE